MIENLFQSDVLTLAATIRPLLKGEDERRSLDVRASGHGLEVRLRGRTVQVRPVSLNYTREQDEWGVLAEGCLDRLRNNHSMAPPTVYSLEDVYREINLVLLGVFQEALSAEEYARFLNAMDSADLVAIEDDAARLKAMNQKLEESLVLAVKSKPAKPQSATPWTGDVLKGKK